MSRSLLLCTLPLLALFAACKPSPKVAVVGSWNITVQGGQGLGDRTKLKAEVRKDGTYTLSGGIELEAAAGKSEVTGTYEFTDDLAIRVTMDGKPMGYEPTDYKIEVISRSELLLNTADYTVVMKRD